MRAARVPPVRSPSAPASEAEPVPSRRHRSLTLSISAARLQGDLAGGFSIGLRRASGGLRRHVGEGAPAAVSAPRRLAGDVVGTRDVLPPPERIDTAAGVPGNTGGSQQLALKGAGAAVRSDAWGLERPAASTTRLTEEPLSDPAAPSPRRLDRLAGGAGALPRGPVDALPADRSRRSLLADGKGRR